jgi:dolichol-phosphate mannosyltransferase
LILHLNNKSTLPKKEIYDSSIISIIAATKDDQGSGYLNLYRLEELIPKAISYEVLLIHYNTSEFRSSTLDDERENHYTQNKGADNMLCDKISDKTFHLRNEVNFTQAVLEGLKSATGKYILVVDADFHYPEDLVCKLVEGIIEYSEILLIASRYTDSELIHKLSLMRTMVSKSARLIVKYGLKVKDVHDPLSRCFAISRDLLENIHIDGKSEELLLELLVKINRISGSNKVTIKEIPFGQKSNEISRKLDFNRVMGYPNAVWELYRYGTKSKTVRNNLSYVEQKRPKSVLFLSKAGRFLTVGASGLFVNYAVSLLVTNLIPNIWYIHATLFGILTSISTNFLLNKVWTFEDWNFSTRHAIRQYILFLVFCSFGAAIQLGLVSLFVDFYHVQYAISLVMAVAVASIGNFLLNKKITFGEKIWE